jgi:hypothetical protein
MTSTTLAASTPTRRVRPLAAVLPSAAALLYAGIQFDAGVVVGAFRSTSTVPDNRLNFPLSGNLATTAEVVWGVSQVAFLVALVAFGRRTAVASSRPGRIGARAAVVGGALFLGGHVVCLIFRDARLADPAGVVAASLFFLGSVLIAAGFLAAGVAVLRGGLWSAWRRYPPVVVGAWMVVMVPLQFTGLLQVAVAVHAVTVGALALALLVESDD